MKSHWFYSGNSRGTAAAIFSRVGCLPNLKLYSRNFLSFSYNGHLLCANINDADTIYHEPRIIRDQNKNPNRTPPSMVTEMPMDPSKYGLKH